LRKGHQLRENFPANVPQVPDTGFILSYLGSMNLILLVSKRGSTEI